jgi:hypothetical protein
MSTEYDYYEPGWISGGKLTIDVFHQRPGKVHIADHATAGTDTPATALCGRVLELSDRHWLFRKMEIQPAVEGVCRRCWRKMQRARAEAEAQAILRARGEAP